MLRASLVIFCTKLIYFTESDASDMDMSTAMDVVEQEQEQEEEETYPDDDSAGEVEQSMRHDEPQGTPQDPAHTSTIPDQVPTAAAAAPVAGGAADAPPVPITPAKRPRGRPKGSGKKQRLEAELAKNPDAAAAAAIASAVIGAQPEVKVRRPVGRPRKDGLPAGSLLPPREKKPMGRPRKSAPAAMGFMIDGMASSNVFPVMAPVRSILFLFRSPLLIFQIGDRSTANRDGAPKTQRTEEGTRH